MGLRSTAAVVSRTIRMTGSSKLVSLVTERYGLVKVVAKGARRPKSKFGASLEPVSLIDCTYYYRDSRDLQTISDADLIDSYSELKTDIRLLSIASCMVEIAETQTAQEDPVSGTFPLLVKSLDELRRGSPKDADKFLWRFMLRFLAAAGYRPDLDRCIACGRNPKGGSVFFSFTDGGVICSCSDPGDRFGIRVSPGALMIMNELTKAKPDALGRLKMTRAQRAEVEQSTLRFLSFHTGYSRPPRSLTFLRKIDGVKDTSGTPIM